MYSPLKSNGTPLNKIALRGTAEDPASETPIAILNPIFSFIVNK